MPKDAEPALFGDDELAPVPERVCTEALAIYNEAAKAGGWPEARFLTSSRRSAMRRAVKDYGGLAGLKAHLDAASRNDFLTGKTWRDEKHLNWRPDLDWFLKPANVLKVLEGKWPANTGASGAQNGAAARVVDPLEDQRLKLRGYRLGRPWLWPAIVRPELPGAERFFDGELLREWRERNMVQVAPTVQETEAQRLAHTITAYRQAGKWADANRVEERLAALEGRPPVLVPAPDVRRPGPAAASGGQKNRPSGRPGSDPGVTDVGPEAWEGVPEGDDYGSED